MMNDDNLRAQVEELREKVKGLEKRLAKSEKVKTILMERVERSVDSSGDSYAMFERNILLQQHVEKRTRELADVNRRLLAEIKERERIEKDLERSRDDALRASRVKSDFLANMSHEIRTPMNAILGMADLLWESPLNAEQKKYVQVFRNSGEHLLQLINDILDVSKVEAGHLELEHTPFDLNGLIEGIGEVMAMRAHHKGLELTCRVMDDVPFQVKGDPSRLRQIFVNLVGNAIKFTEEGEISVGVKRNASLPGGKGKEGNDRVELLFSVTDTGIGIAPEKQDSIFDCFTQAESSITRKYGGTGLGLTISRRLVELMGGRIWLESSPDVGSTFFFVIPFEVVPESPEEREIPASGTGMEGMRVLV
ncbi:MAG: hybrid sensor histidine kinase/response regulator, partial [Deltaproteobacteria bacterium]|nr:hybrid sensor histidine kinase/response regulator [Deltaproteobacteria bacterium]